MSAKYDEYIITHKNNVTKAFDWLCANLPEIFPSEGMKSQIEWQCTSAHDQSKYTKEEYDAYDAYFYGNRSYETVQNFKVAWLQHIHKNPHHWQHWILINDEHNEGVELLEIPFNYIIEMICDWWSFSWRSENLYEIFDWYAKHRDTMQINDSSRRMIEDILNKMRTKLDDIYG
jgi:hypothetical protein